MILSPFENQDCLLSLREMKLTRRNPLRNTEAYRRSQAYYLPVIRSHTTVLGFGENCLPPSIVESRLKEYSQTRVAVDTFYHTMELLKISQFPALHETWHEVGELDSAF